MRTRGFTLIEIIVVLVLLGVLGGLVVARLSTARSRALLVEAERVGLLFDAAARRATMRGQPVLVRFVPALPSTGRADDRVDTGGGSFVVMSRAARVGRFALEQSDWEADPLIAPAVLNQLRVGSVLRNDAGLRFDEGFGVVLNDPGVMGERTTIRLVPGTSAFGSGAGGRVFEIRLSSDARRVRMIADPASLDAGLLTPDGMLRLPTLDLDASGFDEVSW